MYSFPDLEQVCYFMSISNCRFLTCIQIFRRQVRWSGIPICNKILADYKKPRQSLGLRRNHVALRAIT